MELLSPYALFLLPLVAVLLFVARQRIARPRRAVANLYLWRETRPLDPASLAMRRLRKHRLLALQIAFMLAVIAALTRPALTWGTRRATFVFDISASMGARDGSTTRLDVARQRARAVLDALPARTRVRVITAATVPADEGEFSAADPGLRRTIDALRPAAGPAGVADAIGMAHTIGSDRDVYVFSDEGAPSPDDAWLHWQRVGSPAENVAVTTVAARRLPLTPGDGQVLVAVRNFGAQPHETPLDIFQDEVSVSHEVVHLDPRSTRTVVVNVHGIGGVIRARLAAGDALDSDNQRYTLVPPADPVRVLMTARGSFFLDKALSSNPKLAVDRDRRPGVRYDVIVCDRCPDTASDEAGVLMVAPRDGEPDAAQPLTLGRPAHSVVTGLDLGDVVASPASRGTSPGDGGDGDVLLRAGGVPVVTAFERDGRRSLELNLNVTTSTLPLSTAFPVLIANAIDWLAARDETPAELVPGEPWRLTVRDPRLLTDTTVVGPGGERLPFQVNGRHVTLTSTSAAGVYRLRGRDAEHAFTVNVATDTESDLQPRATFESTSATQGTNVAQPPSQSYGEPRRSSPDQQASGGGGFSPALVTSLMLIALALLLTEWWFWSPPDRRQPAILCRAAVVALVILTVTGLKFPWGDMPTTVMFALDRSASLPGRVQARALGRLNQMTAGMAGRDRAGLVAFGNDAAVERRPAESLRIDQIASTLSSSGTNIELALRTARAVLPRDGSGRIVLMSDGRETTGQAEREAARAAAVGIRIDTIPVDAAGFQRPIVVNGVTAPADVRIGEPFGVSVDVAGAPGAKARLTVFRGGDTAAVRDVTIPPTGVASIAFTDERRQSGVIAYRAVVHAEGEETFGDDAGAGTGTIVSVSGKPSVLYVGTSRGPLPGVLAGADYQIRQIEASQLPPLNVLAGYDAIVLDDVQPDSLQADGARALAAYVEQAGGGLLILGGPRSLDAAGYPQGPLGKLLPVDLRPRSGRRGPAMGLVVVFDKSGSMADEVDGVTKIEVARQAVKRVLDVVPSTDSVGIVAFDAAPVVIAALTSASDAGAIVSRMRALEPGGSTAIAPAMTLAVDWLGRAAVSRRYVLLVSDGRTQPADAERLRTAARAGRIELSVIAIGADADRGFLEQLAKDTGGRAYFPDDIRDLPILAAREAARAAGGGSVQEHFTLRAAAHPVTAGLDRRSMPDMGGYVVSAVKLGAEPMLLSHLDDPVLAGWRFGLGRVAVYTADLNAPWSGGLRVWNSFSPLWVQTVRWLSRRTSERSLQTTIVERGDGTHLVVNATTPSGALMNLLSMHATVRGPSGHAQDLPVHAVAPGLYESRIDAAEPGPYLVTVSGRAADGGSDLTALGGFYWSADRERRASGVDMAFLARLAQMTGGRVLGPDDNPFAGARPRAWREIGPVLAIAALLLFLVEIAIRRGMSGRRLRHGGSPALVSQVAA